ncbi:hypothetical protein CHS0354_010400 [Potamilus streckersoni]|uniref:Uncharacterized protein n=1 Tax=Potamilus streckersoni TaxID=2493646 RepID=A0AAE0TEQ2_9BIVA|nr:hypothetical protein CHS0354_010400 [Potamilus streckersoni]
MELHNSIFSGIVLILVLSANRCIGYPTKAGYSRLRRTRENMCPVGMNPEQCFYSHLSMYIKLQNSLTDPVSLRNIGKRNTIEQQVVPSRDNFIDIDDSVVDNVMDPVGFLSLRSLPNTRFVTGKDLISSETGSYQFNGNDFLAVVQRPLETEDKEDGLAYSANENDESIGRIVKKNGIICPPGMKRIQCYDNVLAYYIRLLKVIGDQ